MMGSTTCGVTAQPSGPDAVSPEQSLRAADGGEVYRGPAIGRDRSVSRADIVLFVRKGDKEARQNPGENVNDVHGATR